MSARRRCPVCGATVFRTPNGNVLTHHDPHGIARCPMSGDKFDLCEPWTPRVKHLWERRAAA